MDLQIKGQKALITGGTKGIGRAIADALADEGSNVSICARNEDDVNAAVEALSAKGVTAFGQSVDVGDGEALAAWITASAEALGGIDTIVANVSGGNARSLANRISALLRGGGDCRFGCAALYLVAELGDQAVEAVIVDDRAVFLA